MISVDGLTVEFSGFALFDGVFVCGKTRKTALHWLVKNGAGKSTMLKNICRPSATYSW